MPSFTASHAPPAHTPHPVRARAPVAGAASDREGANPIVRHERPDPRTLAREKALDEALEMTFPASDPVAFPCGTEG